MCAVVLDGVEEQAGARTHTFISWRHCEGLARQKMKKETRHKKPFIFLWDGCFNVDRETDKNAYSKTI